MTSPAADCLQLPKGRDTERGAWPTEGAPMTPDQPRRMRTKSNLPGWPSRAPCHPLPGSQPLRLTTGTRRRTLHTTGAPCPLRTSATLVRFPKPGARELQRLGRHLQRGVLAERLCRSRGDRRGPLRPHRAPPHKLERGRTCQLLDTRRFLKELRAHLQDGRQEPEYQIRLCFGKEYPGPPDQPEERLIMAHVEPVFASELFLHSSITTVVSQRWQVPSPASPDGVTHLLMQLSQQ
ncbi:interferon regulatory factor 4-like isoform X1 [Callorhinus ursinus]|uniref:interferon regulatory factor 4-like isoform X1 n=2 Tax=Callorhinus ursinus TaxID=34884 RepID=UPI003CD04A28